MQIDCNNNYMSKTKETDLNLVVQCEPQPGPSTEVTMDVGHEIDSEIADNDLCRKCFTNKDDQWIQCDSCNKWFYRKCSEIRTAKWWSKFSKQNASWLCIECK